MASPNIDNDIFWEFLEISDFLWIILLVAFAIYPFISASRNKTSVSLGVVLSLLLVFFIQFALSIFSGGIFSFDPIDFFSLIPALSLEPSHFHRLFTAGWIHADWIHVLGNILVIALVGVPLEQRLGAKRWMIVYLLGMLGGNVAWIWTHPDSWNPAVGASGAAFGLLGAYMACWPEDNIEFPLLFFIRAWPVWLIALVRLGLEVYQMFAIQYGSSGETNIAHLAHFGGFFVAYIVARPIARGGPSPLDEKFESSQMEISVREGIKSRMGSLDDDPWSSANSPLEGNGERILRRLREEGDEIETRIAWLEELAENTICPYCGGEVLTKVENRICFLTCGESEGHFKWP